MKGLHSCVTIVDGGVSSKPRTFRDLDPGTWFRSGPGNPLWIKVGGTSDLNVVSPENGIRYQFGGDQRVHAVYDVEVTVREVVR